jgi:sugar/nucleoside kinase (ribokinase family)
MSLLVVGSMAYDTIRTPHGGAENALGGSAVYFSIAASLLAPVRLVGVVGGDFAKAHVDLLQERGVDTGGLEVIPNGKTFRWAGEYSADMNHRETLSVHLNVFEDFQPKIPANFRDSRFVFLANAAPLTQLSVLDQIDDPEFVVADTMDLWISTARDDLLALLRRVDGIVINDSEAHLLTEESNMIRAGKKIQALGPAFVILKKGEHGALLFCSDYVVPLPAYPTPNVVDPTGAGDSFAGGMMGFIAKIGRVDDAALRRSLAFGTVAASFTVQGYGTEGLRAATPAACEERFEEYSGFLRI